MDYCVKTADAFASGGNPMGSSHRNFLQSNALNLHAAILKLPHYTSILLSAAISLAAAGGAP